MARIPLLLLLSLATVLFSCSRDSETDCDRGLCGHKWALELESAVAIGEARVQAQPNDASAFLGLADAYIRKAYFIKNQEDTRVDFWLSSHLSKIDRILDDARNLCEKALRQGGDSATAYDLEGKAYLLKSELTREWDAGINLVGRSISSHQKAVALRPTSAQMWLDLGTGYRRLVSWYPDETQKCLQKALQLDSTCGRAYAELGICGWNRQESMSQWDRTGWKALHFGSNDPEALRLVASTYDRYWLLKSYLGSLRSTPTILKGPFIIGVVFFQAWDEQMRARLYDQIVHLDHHFLKDHLQLGISAESFRHLRIWGETLGGMGEANGPRSFFEAASKSNPNHPLIYLYWGRSTSNPDVAVGLFKRAIALDSNLSMAYYLLAATYVEKEDWSSAALWLAESLRRGARDEFITVNAHLLSAFVQAQKKNYRQLVHECETAFRIDSGYTHEALTEGIFGRSWRGDRRVRLPEPLEAAVAEMPTEKKTVALINFGAGKAEEYARAWGGRSVRFYQKAAELDPDNEEMRFALAYAYSSTERKDEAAIKLVQKMIKLHPLNAKAHRVLGSCYLNANLLGKARGELERAHELGDFEAKLLLDMVKEARAEKGM